MTHLPPAGGVPRVHGARSPVPPRLLLFATPRSVRHLATIAAGPYPLRRPPDAWSPGVPARPGPCYWLVASGISIGCLATVLVCGSVCHHCLGECSALFVCARRLRQVRGVSAGAGSCVRPVPPLPPCVSRAACGGSSCPGVPYPCPLVRHSVRSVHSAGLVRLPFWYFPRALCVCVGSRSCGVPTLPSSKGRCGARTSRGFGAGRR